jgi:transcriptional regulator with XRE-family HTH domain
MARPPTIEAFHMTRLTLEDVSKIRAWHASGVSGAECARRIGISQTHANDILRGERWTGERRKTGGAHPRLVSAETVSQIMVRVAAGEKHEAVAFDLGVSRSYVTHLANGKRRPNG